VPAGLAGQDAVPSSAASKPWNEPETKSLALQLHVTAMEDGAFFSQNAANVDGCGRLQRGPERPG